MDSQISSTYVVALVYIQVCIHVSLVCSPDCAGHAGPWLLEGQNTLNVIAMNFLARHWVDDRGLDTEERKRSRSRLCGCYTAQGCDDVGTGLGLPVCLSKVSILLVYTFAYHNLRQQHVPPPYQQSQSTTSRLQQRSAPRRIQEFSDSSSGA
jgi:hypothetical protein